jgi:hypothetical protein
MESEHLKVAVRIRPLLGIDNTSESVIYTESVKFI